MSAFAEGLPVPLRTLEAYSIMLASTQEPSDLVQAWSSSLLAQGDVTTDDRQGKSKYIDIMRGLLAACYLGPPLMPGYG